MIEYTDMEGCFNSLPDDAKETVRKVVANFHYDIREMQDNGSMGVIKITHGELNNALAFAMRCREGERL